MKVFRKWYWFLSAFVKKYALGIIIGGVIGVLAFSNAGRLARILPVKETRYVGRVGNTTLSQLPLDIQQKVSSGLTKIKENGQVELDIAQNMKLSSDGSEYRFTLDPNTFYSDGTKLTASSIQLELKDVEIQRPSEEVIIFKLKEPFSPFLSILSQPLLKRDTTGKIVKKTHIIGVNDYRIIQINTRNQYLSDLKLSSPKETLIYRFYPTEEEALTAFKLGKVDQLDQMSSPYLEDWNNVEVIKNESDRYLALFFNTTDANLQDKTVRQLLTYATPKKQDESRVISPIDKDSWVYNPQVKPYHYDLDTARAMYEKIKEANPNLALSFEITTTPAYTDMAQQIIDSWRQIDIDAKLKIVTVPDINDYQILLIGQQIPADPDQYMLWHSTQATNITHYQNPKIDKLLEDGRQELDPEKRKQIYQDFQRFLVEDSPVAFLHQLHTYTIKRF